MAKLFPGILYSIPAAIPGWIVGALVADPNLRARSVESLAPILLKGALFFVIWFGVITLVYGTVSWLLLRLTGLLNLTGLVCAALLPVVTYIAWSIATKGYASGWPGVLAGFGIPALAIGIALWWFTVAASTNV